MSDEEKIEKKEKIEKNENGDHPQLFQHNYNNLNIRHNNNQMLDFLSSVQKKESRRFYSINLKEKNFRWSMILSIGSKKKRFRIRYPYE